jgi:hypothetical protein
MKDKIWWSCLPCDFVVCPKCHFDKPEDGLERFVLCKKCDPVNGTTEYGITLRKKHND